MARKKKARRKTGGRRRTKVGGRTRDGKPNLMLLKRGGYASEKYHKRSTRKLSNYNKFMRDYLLASLPSNPTKDERKATFKEGARQWRLVKNSYIPSY